MASSLLHNQALETCSLGANDAMPETRLLPEANATTSEDSLSPFPDALEYVSNIPWWKRPSPYWLLVAIPISTITKAATMPSQITVYTQLVCRHLAAPTSVITNVPVTHTSQLALGLSAFSKDALMGIYEQLDDNCSTDPHVQATVARLIAVMATSMGILSCITTGWWGLYSDRRGRTRVMGIGMLGFLFNDIVFIAVAKFSESIPGGYWNLILGPIVEGMLGGFTACLAAFYAYIADTTTAGERSHVYSLALGLVFTGMALGPSIGSLMISWTGHILSVFYMTTIIHFLFLLYVFLVMPESVTKERMLAAHDRHTTSPPRNSGNALLGHLKRIFSFLAPLSIFLPSIASPGFTYKRCNRDWNLTFIAGVYAFTVFLMGITSYQFQYANLTFHWDEKQLGFFLSLISSVRAIYLMVILPVLLKYFKSKPSPIRLEGNDHPPQPHKLSVDIILMRGSIFLEIVSYTGLTFVKHPLAYIIFGICGAFAAGVSPAAHSIALESFAAQGGHETGRLFGAFSVVQALSSQIIGPSLFGYVYMTTVATFPSAIFLLSAICVFIAFLFSCFVKDPSTAHSTSVAETPSEEI